MQFSRQEYWSGLHAILQGIKPGSPALQADSLQSEPIGKLFHSFRSLISFNTLILRNFLKWQCPFTKFINGETVTAQFSIEDEVLEKERTLCAVNDLRAKQ